MKKSKIEKGSSDDLQLTNRSFVSDVPWVETFDFGIGTDFIEKFEKPVQTFISKQT